MEENKLKAYEKEIAKDAKLVNKKPKKGDWFESIYTSKSFKDFTQIMRLGDDTILFIGKETVVAVTNKPGILSSKPVVNAFELSYSGREWTQQK